MTLGSIILTSSNYQLFTLPGLCVVEINKTLNHLTLWRATLLQAENLCFIPFQMVGLNLDFFFERSENFMNVSFFKVENRINSSRVIGDKKK